MSRKSHRINTRKTRGIHRETLVKRKTGTGSNRKTGSRLSGNGIPRIHGKWSHVGLLNKGALRGKPRKRLTRDSLRLNNSSSGQGMTSDYTRCHINAIDRCKTRMTGNKGTRHRTGQTLTGARTGQKMTGGMTGQNLPGNHTSHRTGHRDRTGHLVTG